MTERQCRVWLAVVWLCLSGSNVCAHEVRPALLIVEQVDVRNWRADFKQPIRGDRYLNLSVDTNCQRGPITSVPGSSMLTESFQLDCRSEKLSWIQITGLEGTLTDTLVSVVELGGSERTYLVSSRNALLALETASSAPAYFRLGVEHFLLGTDHLLFMMLLLYLVHGWRRLALVITSFTAAHSITLVLSSLNLIAVRQAPVEALIALSILLLAVEVVKPQDSLMTRSPWVVTGIFGLLHGLGFAGALADVGLPEQSRWLALLLFNVGIEIAQLVVVAAVVLFGIALRRFGLSNQILSKLLHLPVWLAGVCGSFWFVARSAAIVG